jgi:WD40 repeat protein
VPLIHFSSDAEVVGPSDVCFTGTDGANLLTLTPDGVIRLWDVAMLKPHSPVWEADVKPYLGGSPARGAGRIRPSHDGRAAAFTSSSCTPHVVQLQGEKEPLVGRGYGHAMPVTAVAWHPSLYVLASGSADKIVNISHLVDW